FWDDLDIETANDSAVYTDVVGTAPARSYVVEWRNARFYSDQSSNVTFEVIFHENSNQIEFQYTSLNGAYGGGVSATVGIQNFAQNTGLEYSHDASVLTANMAVRILALVTPGDQSAYNSSCNNVSYTSRVINATGIANSFRLSVADSNPDYHSVVTPTNTGVLPAGASAPFTVTVNVPSGAAASQPDVTSLTVALDDPSVPLSETVHLTTAPGAEFAPLALTRIGVAGATLSYTSTLRNRTNQATNFQVTSGGNTWPATVMPSNTGPIPPAGSAVITVSLMIPANAQPGESDTVQVTATGQLSTTCTVIGTASFTALNGNQVTRRALPLPRARHALVDYPPNGRAYLLGGATSNNDIDLPILEYDARQDTWTARRHLLQNVSNVGAATLGGTIYVPGGFDGTSAISLLQTYDPPTDGAGIMSSDPLPAPRYGAGVAALGGRMYVIGGSDGVSTTRTLYEFDPARPAGTRWATKASMPTARSFLAAAALNGRLYAIGGISYNNFDLSTVEVYDPATNSWSATGPLTAGRGGVAAVGVDSNQPCGGYLYAFGGGWSTPLASTGRYSPVSGTWSPGAPMGAPRRTLAATYVSNGHLLLIVGGFASGPSSVVDGIGCGGSLPTPTATPIGGVPTFTPVPTATPCGPAFSDVAPTDYFYTPVRNLVCRGAVSGYADGTFRPYANMTRAQLCKVVVLGEGWPLVAPAEGHFSDVPPDSPFYAFVETAYAHGIISGYADGTFGGGNNVTRGQITKIVSLAEGWPLFSPDPSHFSDVPPSDPFYAYVETAYAHGIVSGYADGTFRPYNSATRGQVSKMVYLALTGP
ncbi:MAG TPA: S-layer homology domain-containing protein, partial [Chloroflexia bacterium]|nr:S-layer homology domain-containing protein [Chloroflexia bacterium]